MSFSRLTIPLALTLALCNMDRIVLSVAMLAIGKEFGFSLAQQVGLPVPCVLSVLPTCGHTAISVSNQWMCAGYHIFRIPVGIHRQGPHVPFSVSAPRMPCVSLEHGLDSVAYQCKMA